MSISQEIFRAYDIRGVVDKSLTADGVQRIGCAIGTRVRRSGANQVVVARDGRLSGERFLRALCEGIQSTGCDVVDIGCMPTPVLYFAIHYLKVGSGVMITGSHNPVDYNGLKMVINQEAIYGADIQQLYACVQQQDFLQGEGAYRSLDITKAYVQGVCQGIQLARTLKVVVDCGNGVAGAIAPQLYQALGCDVVPLFCEVDGNFPNHHPDPGQPKNLVALQQAVLHHQADLGLAFDGDGDRLGLIDNHGKIIWPDRQLIAFSQRLPKGSTVIFDVKCSQQVSQELKKLGLKPLMWKTGHSFIKAKIRETGALLAGEMSGHVFFNDRWYGFDDGLYAGARMIEEVSNSTSCAAVFSTIPERFVTPEIVLKTEEAVKFSQMEAIVNRAHFPQATVSTIDGLRADFEDGFGLVRPSNTGPNFILRFEGETQATLERIQAEFRQVLLQVNPEWVLPF